MPDASQLLCVLKDAVRNVFESIATQLEEVELDPADDAHSRGRLSVASAEGDVAIASEAVVEFSGKVNGAIVLRCSADAARDIARGFLMLEPHAAIAVEDVNDALGECANMVTGSVKTRMLDPHGVFNMGLPRVSSSCATPGRCRAGALAWRLTTGAMSAEIWVEPNAKAA